MDKTKDIYKFFIVTLTFVVFILCFCRISVSADVMTDNDCVVNFSDYSLAGDAGVVYSEEYKYATSSGASLIKVAKTTSDTNTTMFSFSDYGISTNWSGCDYIIIPIYSKVANDEKLNVIFSKSASTINSGYYFHTITINWTGWRVIKIKPEVFTSSRGITSWQSIDAMYFNIGGWGNPTPKISTELYIPFVKGFDSSKYTASSTAIYAGVSGAIKDGEEVSLSYAPEFKNNRIYFALNTVSELLNNVKYSDNCLNISGINFEFNDSSDKVCSLNSDYVFKLKYLPYTSDGVMYVSLEDLCDLFGIQSYTEDRFAIIGSADDISKIREYESDGLNILTETMAKVISDVQSLTPTEADCSVVIKRWVDSIAGTQQSNDMSDDAIKSRVNTIAQTAQASWDLLIKNNVGKNSLFTGVVLRSSADMTSTARHIYNMALAYATYGTGDGYYLNSSLLSDILYSLEWFYENCYGIDEAENNSNAWRDHTAYDWYDWRIATPKYLIPTMMILETYSPNSLTDAMLSDYLVCFDAVSPEVYSTGANYINSCKLILGAALLRKDVETVVSTVDKAAIAFEYVDDNRNTENRLYGDRNSYTTEKGQGFYTDGSYIYHTLHAMNGTYGIEHLKAASELLSILNGTVFEMPGYCIGNFADWIINSFDNLIYKARIPRMVLGRVEAPTQTDLSYAVVASIMRCFEYLNDTDAQALGSIVKTYVGKSGYNTYSQILSYAKSVDFADVPLLRSIGVDNSYNSYEYEKSSVLSNIDKVMHKRSNWAGGISMSSSRIFNYESINNSNKNGWYLGDGRTEIFIKDESATNQKQYWTNIDYYRLPGTTVDTQERQEVSIYQGNEYLSSKDFVGGVELEGKYCTAAMHLESYHNDTDFGEDGGSYGGKAPAHTSDLTAKKSYFMFDNEVFCLGADVFASNNNDSPVLTIIENRMTSSDSVQTNNGSIQLDSTEKSLRAPSWVNLDENMGYYFPVLSIARNVKGRITDSGYFECIINHGTNPNNSSYAYAILPSMTSAQTRQYAANPDVEILANTSSVQAVRNNKLNITSIVFWEAGTYDNITVSEPMMVMIKRDGENITLSVSDPTHKLTTASLTIDNGYYTIVSGGERMITNDDATDGKTHIVIDFTSSYGTTVEAKLCGGEFIVKAVDFTLNLPDGTPVNSYLAHQNKNVDVYAHVTLKNNSSTTDEDVNVYYAMYNSDGALEEVEMSSLTLKSGETKSVSLKHKPTSDTAELRVYIWQNETNIPCKTVFLNY